MSNWIGNDTEFSPMPCLKIYQGSKNNATTHTSKNETTVDF